MGKSKKRANTIMNLVDVHAHLELFDENALKDAIARAEKKGVKAIITNSVDSATMRKALQLQKEFKIVKAALGVYPVNAAAMNDAEMKRELQFMESNGENFVAFGEIGLDYEQVEDRERQQMAFEAQLQLAKRLSKPVIVHSRKAEKEVIDTLISSGCKKIILHAFHGSMKLVKAALDEGFCFSIPSSILRSSHFQKICEIAPLGSLFTETDAPYLGPYSDRRSEPAHVALTVEKIAEIRKATAAKVAEKIFENYSHMFMSSRKP